MQGPAKQGFRRIGAALSDGSGVGMFGDETRLVEEFPRTLRERNLPLFRSPDRALRAMAHVNAYGRARTRNPLRR
jgi:acyl-CoA synthetase (NDP forming)